MKARKVAAWICAVCRHCYGGPRAKDYAEACCSCATLGCPGRPLHVGGLCASCAADKELRDAQENLARAQARLDTAYAAMGRRRRG